MEIHLPPDQLAIVESLVTSGRFQSADEAITEGVKLLASLENLRQKVQIGIDQANRGDLLDHDTVFGRLRAIAASAGSGT